MQADDAAYVVVGLELVQILVCLNAMKSRYTARFDQQTLHNFL